MTPLPVSAGGRMSPCCHMFSITKQSFVACWTKIYRCVDVHSGLYGQPLQLAIACMRASVCVCVFQYTYYLCIYMYWCAVACVCIVPVYICVYVCMGDSFQIKIKNIQFQNRSRHLWVDKVITWICAGKCVHVCFYVTHSSTWITNPSWEVWKVVSKARCSLIQVCDEAVVSVV